MAARRYLVDTHAFLWALEGSDELANTARAAIGDPGAVVFVSIASLWEISIKATIGKLEIPGDFFAIVADSTYEILPISLRHLARYRELPLLHRDPFDRLLVSQAQEDQVILITRDQEIAAYDGLTIVEA